jgi:hypothetical protein
MFAKILKPISPLAPGKPAISHIQPQLRHSSARINALFGGSKRVALRISVFHKESVLLDVLETKAD